MKKSKLLQTFTYAITLGSGYVGVAVQVPGAKEPEYIINPIENAGAKLTYYDKAYNDDLELIDNKDVKIIAVARSAAGPSIVLTGLMNTLERGTSNE